LAALVLALRARMVSLLVAAAEWSDDEDDSDSRKHRRHKGPEGSRAKQCRLSPPPCDGELAAPGAWWRPVVLLPPQAPHLSGRLTVSCRASWSGFIAS